MQISRPELLDSSRWADKIITTYLGRLPAWGAKFVRCLRTEGLKPNTITSYLYRLDMFCAAAKKLGHHVEDLYEWPLDRVLEVLDEIVIKNDKILRTLVLTLKRFFRVFGNPTIADSLRTPKLKRGLPETLSREEVKQLITMAPTLRDRLIIELLDDTGMRVSELVSLKLKDIQFDTHGVKLFIHKSKSDVRVARAFKAKPDLIQWINNHPFRNSPDTSLWLSYSGKWGRMSPIAVGAVQKMIRKLGRSTLNKRVYPHMFRHTTFTRLSQYMTDRELKILGGWQTTDMLETYSHLSGRDVDHKLLAVHGVKVKEFNELLVETRKCGKCGTENAPIAMYCHECSTPLDKAKLDTTEIKEEIRKMLPEILDELKKEEEGVAVPD